MWLEHSGSAYGVSMATHQIRGVHIPRTQCVWDLASQNTLSDFKIPRQIKDPSIKISPASYFRFRGAPVFGIFL